jgi:hypothetical protein
VRAGPSVAPHPQHSPKDLFPEEINITNKRITPTLKHFSPESHSREIKSIFSVSWNVL